MLTQEDLKNIGVELGKVIEQNITPTMDSLQEEVNDIKKDLKGVKDDLKHVENQMVTKDYLDEKLLDFRGDLNIMMRKGDAKLIRLVEFLKEKEILNDSQVQELFSMEPFPKLI